MRMSHTFFQILEQKTAYVATVGQSMLVSGPTLMAINRTRISFLNAVLSAVLDQDASTLMRGSIFQLDWKTRKAESFSASTEQPWCETLIFRPCWV